MAAGYIRPSTTTPSAVSNMWTSFAAPTAPASNSNAGYGGDPGALGGDFLGDGGTLSMPSAAAPIGPRTLPNPNNPGGISDMELESRVRNLRTTATTTANNNAVRDLNPATPVMTKELSDQLTAMGTGATGAYNAVSDSGRAQYDYMHELGSPDFIQSPREAINAMGETVGASHVGDVTMSDPLGITNPLDMLKNPGGTLLGGVADPNRGLGFTGIEMPGGAAGGKPITNMTPETRAAAETLQNGGGQVDNILGLNMNTTTGGTGGSGSGTTLDQGRGISLPDQLVRANAGVGHASDLEDSIRNGEFAPPPDARQLQLNAINSANAFAGAATGPGMGSFLSPPPSPSQPQTNQALRQPVPLAANAASGTPNPAQPGQAQPFNMNLQTSSPVGPAAAAAAGTPPAPNPQPSLATNPANSSFNLSQGSRAHITNQMPAVPPHDVTGGSVPTNPVLAPDQWAPQPSAPAASPLRASIGARQDVGSYLTGDRATDPWSAQVQGFLQAPEGPSAAQAQLTQARDQSMADALSLAHSGRGGAGQQARALRGAMSQNAATQAQTGQAAALLRANEAQNYKQQQLQGLGLGANIAAGKDQNTLGALNLSGNLAQGIDQDTLAGQTLGANTATSTRGLDINEAGQKQQGVLDAEKIAAGRTGDILNASTSAYATDRGIDSKENLGPGDIKYWTDKI